MQVFLTFCTLFVSFDRSTRLARRTTPSLTQRAAETTPREEAAAAARGAAVAAPRAQQEEGGNPRRWVRVPPAPPPWARPSRPRRSTLTPGGVARRPGRVGAAPGGAHPSAATRAALRWWVRTWLCVPLLLLPPLLVLAAGAYPVFLALPTGGPCTFDDVRSRRQSECLYWAGRLSRLVNDVFFSTEKTWTWGPLTSKASWQSSVRRLQASCVHTYFYLLRGGDVRVLASQFGIFTPGRGVRLCARYYCCCDESALKAELLASCRFLATWPSH